MLSVNINQDVEQYQEAVVFGLNARQTAGALLAVLVGAGITCLLYFRFGLSMQISIYTALPFCIPVMLPVMGKQYGLTVPERIRQSNRKKQVLTYKALSEVKKKGKFIQDRQASGEKGDRKKKNGNQKGDPIWKRKKKGKRGEVPASQK